MIKIELSHYQLPFLMPLTLLLLQVRVDTVGLPLKLLVRQLAPSLLQALGHQRMTVYLMYISIVLGIKGVKKWIFL
nr:MAG TPA: hypothetical protein [Caudoviricetes sp.]